MEHATDICFALGLANRADLSIRANSYGSTDTGNAPPTAPPPGRSELTARKGLLERRLQEFPGTRGDGGRSRSHHTTS